MKLFDLFKSKKPLKPAPEIPKKFTFEVLEATKIGDRYQYTIEADTRHEALVKLVKHFYGEDMNQGIESKHHNVTFPSNSTFSTNMPYWFAKRISGVRIEGNKDYQKELEKFAIDNNIKLKQ